MKYRNMKTFDVITLFPEAFTSYFNESILARAQKNKLFKLQLHQLRDFTLDKHNKVDDRPYGGGAGMVLQPEPIVRALKSIKASRPHANAKKVRTILLTPQGKPFVQKDVTRLGKYDRLVFVCGRYEGFDERVRSYVDEEISLGDFVLTGGELAAMSIIDAVARFIPGVLGDATSSTEESFSDSLLEYPHYTRPEVFEKKRVPKILLSGDHAKVAAWRKQEALKRTKKRRPDLLKTT